MPKAPTLQNLPRNILIKIANSSNSKSMQHLSETSKQLHNVIKPRIDVRVALRRQLEKAIRSSREERMHVIKTAIFFARALFQDHPTENVEPIDHTVDIGSYRIRFKMNFQGIQKIIDCYIRITHKNKDIPLQMVLSYGINDLGLRALQGNENWVDDAMQLIYATKNASKRNKSPLFILAHPNNFRTNTNGRTKTITSIFWNPNLVVRQR